MIEITTNKAPAAIGPYSQAVVVGDMIYTSGQIPVNPQNGKIPDGAVEQANQMVNDAQTKAMEIKTDCDQYADDILNDLEKRLDMLLRKVHDDKAYFDNK